MDTAPLIEAAYDAALEPERWRDFAEALSSSCGGAPLLLALRAPGEDDRGDVIVAGIEDHHRDAYCTHDWSADPLIADDLLLPSGAVLFRHEHLMAEAPADREFTRRWLAPQKLRPAPTISGLILGHEQGPSAYLHLFSRRRSRALGDAEYALVRGLMPHLQRAALMLREGQRLRFERHAALLGLEAQTAAVLLLEPAGEILFTSDRAARLLEKAELPPSDLATAVLSALHGAPRQRTALRLGDARSRRRIEVIIQPTSSRPAPGEPPEDLVLVLLRDPMQAEAPDAAILRQLYGLTGAEARLAALLAEGISPAGAAARFGVSLHTVRRQVKDIFAKTGVARQSALVALLAGVPRTSRPAKDESKGHGPSGS